MDHNKDWQRENFADHGYVIDLRPKLSNWTCHMFGAKPGTGFAWRPNEGNVPNFFWRWMQYLFFGNRWIKDKPVCSQPFPTSGQNVPTATDNM